MPSPEDSADPPAFAVGPGASSDVDLSLKILGESHQGLELASLLLNCPAHILHLCSQVGPLKSLQIILYRIHFLLLNLQLFLISLVTIKTKSAVADKWKIKQSQLFISLEDLFYTWEASWVVKCLRRMYAAGAKAESGRVSSPRIVSRALIGWARRRIRTRAGDIRRSLVRRDDWLDRTMPLG